MSEGSKMLYPSWAEYDRAFAVWWRHHPQWAHGTAWDEFCRFTGLNQANLWAWEPTEEQVERVRKLAGPYGDALLAIYLAKGGMHHGTGQ